MLLRQCRRYLPRLVHPQPDARRHEECPEMADGPRGPIGRAVILSAARAALADAFPCREPKVARRGDLCGDALAASLYLRMLRTIDEGGGLRGTAAEARPAVRL